MKIKLSKSQWESIGQKTGWMKREAFVSSSEVMPPEFEKNLKKLAISYSKGEMGWDKVSSEILGMTQDNPKLRQIALDTIIDYVTRLSQAEQKKQEVMASKKSEMEKTASVNPGLILDRASGQNLNLNEMSLNELVELYEAGDLSDEDYRKVEAALVQKRSGAAEARFDAKKENIASSKKMVKAQGGFGGGGEGMEGMGKLQLNKDYDVKKYVNNEKEAIQLLWSAILIDPNILPRFVGLTPEQLTKKFNETLPSVSRKYNIRPPSPGEELRSYNDVVHMMQTILQLASRNPQMAQGLTLDLMGLDSGSNKVVKRLHEFVPLAIRGEEELQETTHEMGPSEKKSYEDYVLDLFNAGKITKEEVQSRLQEVASLKQKLMKTAGMIWK